MKKLLMAMLALVMMAGCSSETSKPAQVEKPQPKPAEFVTGRAAFQKLFIAARGWARDAQPYRLESMITDDSKGKEGKSAVWRASFGSPLQRGVKAYTWSGEVSSDRGINPGTEDTYSPSNTSTQIFDVAFLKVDSDQALETAQKHAMEDACGVTVEGKLRALRRLIYCGEWIESHTLHIYMREVVTRRYKRIQEEKKKMPSLVLIDGGLGQLHG